MKRIPMACASVLVFAAVACSSSDSSTDGESVGPTEASAPTTCTDPVESASIDIKDFAFSPDCVALPAGTSTLSVTNSDSTAHTFTILAADLSEDLDPGADVAVDVSALNDQQWEFRCNIHPQMKGVLVIG